MAQKAGERSVAFTDRAAAEDIVRINRTYDNEETNPDFRVALRMFRKRVTDGKDVPDSIWRRCWDGYE